MKKKILVLSVFAMLAAMLTGCGDTETTETQSAAPLSELKTEEYIETGDYSAFEVTVEPKQEITDDDVDMYIRYVLASYPVHDTEYVVKEGDTVNIDYEGKKDGVAFEGGTAAGFDLGIGSGRFIPGFEDGLIGAKVGETRDINLTFPEDYQAEDLAGADVVFTVTVNHVYATELTDALAAEMNPDAPTIAEYKAYAKDLLIQDAQAVYDNAVYDEITKALMADSNVKKDAPESLVNRYFDQAVDYATTFAMANFNMDYETFVQATGNTVEAYEAGMKEEALSYANNMVLYQAVANAEGLTVTEEDIQAEAEKNAEAAGYESAEAYLESIDRESFKDYLMRTKVLEYLAERTVVTEAVEAEEVPEIKTELETEE